MKEDIFTEVLTTDFKYMIKTIKEQKKIIAEIKAVLKKVINSFSKFEDLDEFYSSDQEALDEAREILKEGEINGK